MFPMRSYVTCHGQSPGATMSPPTIRVWPLPLMPHVGLLGEGDGVETAEMFPKIIYGLCNIRNDDKAQF